MTRRTAGWGAVLAVLLLGTPVSSQTFAQQSSHTTQLTLKQRLLKVGITGLIVGGFCAAGFAVYRSLRRSDEARKTPRKEPTLGPMRLDLLNKPQDKD